MKMYTLAAAESLIQKYQKIGAEVTELREGVLGLGTVVCHGEGLKTAIIQERYINEWSSGHTIRMYNNMPEKYAKAIAAL